MPPTIGPVLVEATKYSEQLLHIVVFVLYSYINFPADIPCGFLYAFSLE